MDAVPAAFTLPDLEFLNEDFWMYELDWMDLPESPTAVATVAVVPTARLNIPKLNNIEMLYDWIDDVRRMWCWQSRPHHPQRWLPSCYCL